MPSTMSFRPEHDSGQCAGLGRAETPRRFHARRRNLRAGTQSVLRLHVIPSGVEESWVSEERSFDKLRMTCLGMVTQDDVIRQAKLPGYQRIASGSRRALPRLTRGHTEVVRCRIRIPGENDAGRRERHRVNVRLWNWIAAIVLTVVLVALAVPRSLLFDGTEWQLAFEGHPWLTYLEVPLYLLGILLATVIVALLVAILLRALSGTPVMLRGTRAILSGAAIFGLSPLQPVFANIIVILLLPTLADAGLGIGSLRWTFTIALVVLFGVALGAELALKVVDSRSTGRRGWVQATAQVIGAQAPALAGRIAVIIMAGPLLMTAIASIGQSPSQIAPDAPRFAFPVEGIIVGFLAAVLGLVLWLLGRKIGGRPDEPVLETPTPSTGQQVFSWAFVALAILLPMALLFTADDPLVQRLDNVQASPSSAHLFGTDHMGRDVYDRLVFAWRDALYGGISIGVVLFGLGLFWRLITPFNRSLLALEPILERMPPGVIFFGLWGAISATFVDTVTIQTVAIASGIILLPTALTLIRRVEVTALPAAGAALAMLGLLLVIGWSTVFGQLGLLTPPIPNFGDELATGREYSVEASWIANYTILAITVAVLLPLMALVALGRCYGISRELIRLRG
jgi:peptide/nickel transport system permease protein